MQTYISFIEIYKMRQAAALFCIFLLCHEIFKEHINIKIMNSSNHDQSLIILDYCNAQVYSLNFNSRAYPNPELLIEEKINDGTIPCRMKYIHWMTTFQTNPEIYQLDEEFIIKKTTV